MMLTSLYEYAQRKGLLEDPDYEEQRVHFIVRVDRTGRFVALLPTADETGMPARKRLPRTPRRTKNACPAFLADNSQYVLWVNKPGKSRGEECGNAFLELVREAAEATGDEAARAVLAFLQNKEQRTKALAERNNGEWKGDEVLAFELVGDDGILVHERPALRQHWETVRAISDQGPGGAMARCLVTGKKCVPGALHPPIKRVPGTASPAILVSFNSEAYESHGLKQAENAPISRSAAEGYAAGLNHLLEQDGKRRFRFGIPIEDDCVLVFWTRGETGFADGLLDLLAPDESDAVRMAESVFRGLQPADGDASLFYGAVLSGSQGRVVVRDWFEKRVGEVKNSLRRYFNDLALEGQGDPHLPLGLLLSSLQLTRDARTKQGGSPALRARLLRSALLDEPFPRQILSLALNRVRVPPGDRESECHDATILRARISLIKATLIRLHRHDPSPLEVTMALDETQTRPGYVLGRLFAVLEKLQAKAIGNPNSTIRDRYFGSASTTPALVFPRLIRLALHHAAKIDNGWPATLLGPVIDRLGAAGFPSTLPLEDQGLFAIGYFHQREALRFPHKPMTTEGSQEASPPTKENQL